MSSSGNTQLGGGLVAFCGLFCLWHVWRDSEWFFKNSKAAFWVGLLGRNGARWFYGILGFSLVLLAVISVLFGR